MGESDLTVAVLKLIVRPHRDMGQAVADHLA